jgi:osmotically-inducible protein OsmY
MLIVEHGRSLSPAEKKDAALKADIADALWKDDVLRKLDYYEIDTWVKDGVVTLNGYISSSGSQNRVVNALHMISGIVEIKNNLVSDDKLTLNVAVALGTLEHTYDCKFFTGASHGVISINGVVKNQQIRLLAEKCASDVPSTRGVINNIQVTGAKLEAQNLPFLQPTIGENIYFLDWVTGVVKKVIINPNNRRVIAMIIQGKFISQQDELNLTDSSQVRTRERLVIVPMNTVRHLTKVSGFLYINSNQTDKYMDFFPAYLMSPAKDWVPPYPYCPEDVMFPVEYKENTAQVEYKLEQYSFAALSKHTRLGEQLLENDSLGG